VIDPFVYKFLEKGDRFIFWVQGNTYEEAKRNIKGV